VNGLDGCPERLLNLQLRSNNPPLCLLRDKWRVLATAGPHHFRVVKGMGTTVVQVVREYKQGIRYDDYSDFLPIGLS
jgi:hypothetical protein